MKHKIWFGLAGLTAMLLALVGSVGAQNPAGTVYTYQGCLLEADGKALNGKYDLQFTLYASPAGGSPVSEAIEVSSVEVADCWCTVQLKFGAEAFDRWEERYVEVGARKSGKADPYTSLLREAILPAPYTLNAEFAKLQATPVPSFGEGLVLSKDNVLSVWFEGSGVADTVARSDHDHDDLYCTQSQLDTLEARVLALEEMHSAPSNLTIYLRYPNLRYTPELQWQDHSANESVFLLERSPGRAANWVGDWVEVVQVEANETSYLDTDFYKTCRYQGGGEDIHCCYRIRAYREADDHYSEYSNVTCVTIPAGVG